MSLLKNKNFQIIFKSIIVLFAVYGFILTASYYAVKLHITDDPGGVAHNDRFFQDLNKKNKINKTFNNDSAFQKLKEISNIYYKIKILNEFYPKNAELIFNYFNKSLDVNNANKMFEVVNYYLKDNWEYKHKIEENNIIYNKTIHKPNNESIYKWMNIPEWNYFKEAVVKDKILIDSAGKLIGIEPRLIVSVLVGEQIRLFNSKREVFKQVIAPLKILSVESVFSLGVTGIKPETAIQIEKYLKDSISVYYIGYKYEKLLDFKTSDIEKERFDRLVNYQNHFFSYLYAAIFIKQVELQWKRSGFDISERPEILATLFNVGFWQSVPKSNPSVGGSKIIVNDEIYTFGVLASDFYYSGELINEFPYHY